MSDMIKPAIDRRPPAGRIVIGERDFAAGSGGVFAHINPANGEHQADVPLAGKAEVEQAVACAKQAFEVWRRMPAVERRERLARLAALIESRSDEFIRLAAIEGGTPVTVGAGGPRLAVEWTNYYAGWADKIDGQVVSMPPADEFIYTLPEPYGVIGIIVTWNGPLISLGMKVAPALAAGNTVVIKPAEQTPFVACLFADLAREAGIPPGVVNVVPGAAEAAEALIAHPDVEKITFTGGPATARKILHQCADLLKPAVLELGGKSANIVFPDADIQAVAQFAAFWSVGLLSGQGCELPTRLLVDDSIYERTVEAVAAVAGHLPVGDPFDPATVVGPLINQAACERVLGMIGRARDSGAGRVITGGERLGGHLATGCYVAPTVIADVDPSSEIARNEVFGPVLVIHRFRTEEEAIAIANSTNYGLGGYLQTNDLKRAQRVATALKTGYVHINGSRNIPAWAPFGGVGLSGYGKEGGRPGLDEFIRLKTVSIPA
ncbi:aldehyde dehydrogenase family protein [Paraburkholderia dinghuensis]|nr:aldehyde dehydrogenase family protein [Paraburkholderia dinghuensis]